MMPDHHLKTEMGNESWDGNGAEKVDVTGGESGEGKDRVGFRKW